MTQHPWEMTADDRVAVWLEGDASEEMSMYAKRVARAAQLKLVKWLESQEDTFRALLEVRAALEAKP